MQKLLMNRIILFLLIIAAGSNAQVKVLTLEDAIKIALDKSWDVRIANQDVQKAEEQINEAYSNAYPSLSFASRYIRYLKLPVMFIPPNSLINPTSQTMTFELGSDNSYDASVTLSQVLYSQKVNTAIKIADDYSQYSKTAYSASRLQTILQVKKAFYNVLLMRELTKVAKKGFESAEANRKNVEALFKQGVASEYDKLRAEVQEANAKPMLIQTENNLKLTQDFIKNLLALDLSVPVEIKGEFILDEVKPEQLESRNADALSVNPILRQLSLNESLLDKSMIIERSEYYPMLALFGQYQWQSQDNTFQFGNYKWANSFFVGLQLSYNLFDGFRRGARIEQARIDKEKVSLTRRKVEEGIKIQIQQAQMKMDEAKKRIEAQTKNLQQAEKTESIAQTRYKSGIGTQLEIIDTQTALVFARTNYAQAIYDYLIAKSDWEFAVSIE
jgi:outer membrane protein TolC